MGALSAVLADRQGELTQVSAQPFERAWHDALYGPAGFYRQASPAQHFRTSVHASPFMATALARLARACGLRRVLDIGSDTVIVIMGLLILTAALLRTGVMDLAGRAILRQTGKNPTRLLVGIGARGRYTQ